MCSLYGGNDENSCVHCTQVYVYDADGVKIRNMSLAAQKNDTFGESPVAAIQWYHPEGGKHTRYFVLT
jgi:hypothetical protein